jgi:lysophospholipase L1-like esterase
MAKISDLPKLANPTGAETVIVSDPADGEKTKTTPLSALVNAAAQPFVDLAEILTKGSWPTPSVDGDGVWEYDSYGLGDAFLPASPVSAATVGTPALDADTAYTFDEYGLGESLLTGERPLAVGQSLDGEDLWAFDAYGLGEELGHSAAVPAVVASSALLPSDFDAIGAWHTRAMGARFRGEQAVVAIIADSQYDFRAGRAAVPFTQRMRLKFGNGGPGWVSPDSSALPVDASYADGEVAIGGNGPGWTVSESGSSPNRRMWANNTVGSTTTLTYSGAAPIATLDLFHGGGSGTISYAYGAAAPAQIVLPATPGKVALPKPPAAGPWTLALTIVSGTFLFAGYDLRTGKGAVVHNLAIGGTTAQGWAAADQEQWRASLALLSIHVAILSLGGNDEVNGRSVASFTVDQTTLVGTLRAIDAGMDIIISVRGQTFRAAGVTPRMADYAAAMRSFAPSWRAAVFDAGKRFGTDPAQYSYTPTGTRFVALQSDNLHFNQLGRDIFVSGPCELLGA